MSKLIIITVKGISFVVTVYNASSYKGGTSNF